MSNGLSTSPSPALLLNIYSFTLAYFISSSLTKECFRIAKVEVSFGKKPKTNKKSTGVWERKGKQAFESSPSEMSPFSILLAPLIELL